MGGAQSIQTGQTSKVGYTKCTLPPTLEPLAPWGFQETALHALNLSSLLADSHLISNLHSNYLSYIIFLQGLQENGKCFSVFPCLDEGDIMYAISAFLHWKVPFSN